MTLRYTLNLALRMLEVGLTEQNVATGLIGYLRHTYPNEGEAVHLPNEGEAVHLPNEPIGVVGGIRLECRNTIQ